MNTNPYSAPSSSIETPTDPNAFQLHDPRTVPVGNSMQWIGDGFGHFKQDVGPWILICIVFGVISIITSIIPFVSFVMALFTYVWVGGLMLGCKAQDDGNRLEVGHLFAGFQNKLGPLILLSVIYFIALIIIVFMTLGSTFGLMMGMGGLDTGGDMDPAAAQDMMAGILLPFLFAMLFILPIIMTVWFAPALIVLNDVPVLKAMGMSFMGCLKNFIPFLLYGIVMLVIGIVAMIPLLLGLLIFFPIAWGSTYRAYKDIYIET